MTYEELQAKLDTTQQQFDAKTAEKTQLEANLEAVNVELYRLQGDYRTLQGLLPTPELNTTDPSTIEVLEAEVVPDKKSKKE